MFPLKHSSTTKTWEQWWLWLARRLHSFGRQDRDHSVPISPLVPPGHHYSSIRPHCCHDPTCTQPPGANGLLQTGVCCRSTSLGARFISWSPQCLAGWSAVLYKGNQASYFHSGVLCCPAILYLAWQGQEGSHDLVCVELHNLWCLHNIDVLRGGGSK